MKRQYLFVCQIILILMPKMEIMRETPTLILFFFRSKFFLPQKYNNLFFKYAGKYLFYVIYRAVVRALVKKTAIFVIYRQIWCIRAGKCSNFSAFGATALKICSNCRIFHGESFGNNEQCSTPSSAPPSGINFLGQNTKKCICDEKRDQKCPNQSYIF